MEMNIDENEQSTPTPTPTQPVMLNVNQNLIKNIAALLEIATSRGTFKATELSSVGKIYDEVSKLLQPTSN